MDLKAILDSPHLDAARPYLNKISFDEWKITIGMLVIPLFVSLVFLKMVQKKGEQSPFHPTILWLLLSGTVHSTLEFTFVFMRDGLVGNATDLYAAADFRYGRPLEAGTAAMETITALFDGPACFLVAYAAVRGLSWRHPLQIVVSVCQLYGLVWFSLQPHFLGGIHKVASSDPFLFWVVFVGLNSPWGIVPLALVVSSFRYICRSINSLKSTHSSKASVKKTN
eukprot:TRINITY_DN12958_c0_g1_i1.p1 TRINITY_DN12958_c0_g1~~TRINITY_DN12958_c0_g1_i1.p1  ORF type:complete len:224 (-),score=76.73 TRINITY_DN12958_c0_g1_i1:63-734(-)